MCDCIFRVSERDQVKQLIELVFEKVESLVREEDFMIYKTAELKDIAVLLKQESRITSSASRFVLFISIALFIKIS